MHEAVRLRWMDRYWPDVPYGVRIVSTITNAAATQYIVCTRSPKNIRANNGTRTTSTSTHGYARDNDTYAVRGAKEPTCLSTRYGAHGHTWSVASGKTPIRRAHLEPLLEHHKNPDHFAVVAWMSGKMARK